MNTLIVATFLTAASGDVPPADVHLSEPTVAIRLHTTDESYVESFDESFDEPFDNSAGGSTQQSYILTAGDCNPRVKVCEED